MIEYLLGVTLFTLKGDLHDKVIKHWTRRLNRLNEFFLWFIHKYIFFACTQSNPHNALEYMFE